MFSRISWVYVFVSFVLLISMMPSISCSKAEGDTIIVNTFEFIADSMEAHKNNPKQAVEQVSEYMETHYEELQTAMNDFTIKQEKWSQKAREKRTKDLLDKLKEPLNRITKQMESNPVYQHFFQHFMDTLPPIPSTEHQESNPSS